jgi:hypothetical protein
MFLGIGFWQKEEGQADEQGRQQSYVFHCFLKNDDVGKKWGRSSCFNAFPRDKNPF